MDETDSANVSRQQKIDALLGVARYNPKFTALIIGLGLVSTLLEGVGLTFIIPIIELVQTQNPVQQADGMMGYFVMAYRTVGIPFTIEYVIAGVAVVMTLRYMTGFFLHWCRGILQLSYERHLRRGLWDRALETKIEFFDEKGSDDILNALITEAKFSGKVIKRFVKLFDLTLITFAYLGIAFWISWELTAVAILVLGGISLLLRNAVGSGYDIGDRIATANERLQQIAQAGMIGIRDIRLFNLDDEMSRNYYDALDQYTESKVTIRRNRAALNKFYNLAVAVFVFVLIYLALKIANLSFGELALFLFVMFQLAPKVSQMNKRFYKVEEALPHMVRTRSFITELEQWQEPQTQSRPVPDTVETVDFDNVEFSYDEDEPVLRGIDFGVEKEEFVAFVGQSGAGKSTIVSLLARFYEPDSGSIRANGNPIDSMDPCEWRERLAIVRQSPYIFNDTLRYNLTPGNRDATQTEIERACEIAKVDEFVDDLPNGYQSQLGDEGVRLSGGQKQRLALARALLKDADLLVLDEATSDLDSNLEKEVQQSIEEMNRDYAIIAIAHRLSTVKSADRIYTMEDGRITERGPHDELVDKNGKYAELHGIQSAR